MKRVLLGGGLLAALLSLGAAPAMADRGHEGGNGYRGGHEFYSGRSFDRGFEHRDHFYYGGPSYYGGFGVYGSYGYVAPTYSYPCDPYVSSYYYSPPVTVYPYYTPGVYRGSYIVVRP